MNNVDSDDPVIPPSSRRRQETTTHATRSVTLRRFLRFFFLSFSDRLLDESQPGRRAAVIIQILFSSFSATVCWTPSTFVCGAAYESILCLALCVCVAVFGRFWLVDALHLHWSVSHCGSFPAPNRLDYHFFLAVIKV